MTAYILLIAGIIFICILLNKISYKLGIPMLLAFIILGMLFGTDGIVRIPFDDYRIGEEVCTVALIFIMFYGGFGTSLNAAKPIIRETVLLSTAGVIMTALLTGGFCYWVLKFNLFESMLLGAVTSSTDAASVFSVLRSKHLNLKYHTASLLEVESGSNDPCSYMMTIMILEGSFRVNHLFYMFFSQIVYGIITGMIMAYLDVWILKKVKFSTNGFDTIFVFSTVLMTYALSSLIGGNGYLSIYLLGIILGNKAIPNKKSLVHFFDGITGLTQMLIFFLLGLLAFPSQLPSVILPSIAIAAFLTFISRPVAVFTVLWPFKCTLNQKLLVSWSGLRGAASIVFAMLAANSPTYMKNDIFHIVFFIVLFSISLQGTLIPFLARKLSMIDNKENVMKTFSDYSEEVPIQFIRICISPHHVWNGKRVKEIPLMPDVLMVLILRKDKRIIPRGYTKILEGDTIVLSALSLDDELGICLSEIKIEKDHDWLNKPLADIEIGSERLIIIIKRENEVIIPNGNTLIKENDILVISQI